jgi:hypothetical protein
MIDLHDYEIWKVLMGKVVFNAYRFIWVKFHGNFSLKLVLCN